MGRHNKVSKVAAATAAIAVTATLPGVLMPGIADAAEKEAPPGGWGPIIKCESGGNPRIKNPSPSSSASGLFQITDPTWRGLGGKGHAKDASVAEQTQRAEQLYAQRGLQPWNDSKHCWGHQIGSAPSPGKHRAPEPGDYEVKPGDTLDSIAKAHGTTWQELYAGSRDTLSNPNVIRPGQRLHLKTSEPKKASAVITVGPTIQQRLNSQMSTGFGGVAPRVAKAGHLIQAEFNVKTVGGVGGRPTPGSDHPSGHALDFMADRATGDRIADFALRNFDALGIKYVIWRQRINEGQGWQPMENRGSVTANHYDHVHVSFH